MRDEAAWARARDDATVEMCERTSWRGPRDFLRDCRGCGMPFWVHGGSRTREDRLHCSHNCYHRAYYHAHHGYRARTNAQRMERHHRAKETAA